MKRVIVFLIGLIFLLTGRLQVAEASNTSQVTVGYYDYEPYFSIDSKGQVTGIYHEIIQRLANDLNFEVHYVMEGFSDIIESSRNNEVDLIVGLHFSEARNQSIVYSDLSIGTEEMAVYMNDSVVYGDLNKLEGKRLALIEDEQNSIWLASFLRSQGIEPEYVYVKSHSEANKMLALGQVEATIGTIYSDEFELSQQLYRYTAGSVYIGGSPRNKQLMHQINTQLRKYANLDQNPIDLIYQKYLPNQNNQRFMTGLMLGIVICFVIIPTIIFYPKWKYKFVRNRIRKSISDHRFLPFYQPIINPHNNEIRGIEALIRLDHPKKGIMSPYYFMEKLEQHEMLNELTLYLLKKVIEDYHEIKNYECFKNQETPFYISLNISSYEIENQQMVNQMVMILKQSGIPKDTICLEIIERFGISNMKEIQKGVAVLKANGFKIAIDDFGVDYSNLKLLEILDFDILKLDKYFADEMEKSKIVKHTIGFLGQLTQKFEKSLVMEGVEEERQTEFLKSYQYPQMFIQGYYYSKPIRKEDLQNFKI